jgi:ATP-dependent Clp protease adapter protein ClpS
MSHVLQPELSLQDTGMGRMMVLIYNNDHNTMDEVMAILMLATRCDEEEAYIEMWEAHTYGKASVHFGSQTECQAVSEVIASIGLKTEVVDEWPL